MLKSFSSGTLELKQGDLTREAADVIVNAANSSLMGGGGVDGAIHRGGGPVILEECKNIVKEQGFLPPGKAVITTAGNLPARFVIHTVGPIWRGGDRGESGTLRECYLNSLELARDNGLTSVAFPSISTGAFGYPVDMAAEVAIGTVVEFLNMDHGGAKNEDGSMGNDHVPVMKDKRSFEVIFVLFDHSTFEVYENALKTVS